MNYIQDALHRLNAELPDLEPELADLYVLLALTTGKTTTLQDVHEAWAIWRNRSNPQHRSLIPFDQLTVEVQELDRQYRDAIREVAEELVGSEVAQEIPRLRRALGADQS